MRQSLAIRVIVLLTGAAPTGLAAQTAAEGDRVRVERISGSSPVTGVLRAVERDGLLVNQGTTGPTVRVPRDDLLSLSVSQGTRGQAKRGAIIGGLFGVGIGVGAVSGLCGGDGDNYCTQEKQVGVLATGIVLSALFGAAVGSLIRSEQWAPAVIAWPEGFEDAKAGLWLGVRLNFHVGGRSLRVT